MIVVIGCTRETIRIKMTEPQGGEEEEEQQLSIFEARVAADAVQDEIETFDSGCGCNIAIALARRGCDTHFISAVGNDTLGVAAKAGLEAAGVKTDGLESFDAATAVSVEFVNIFGDVGMAKRNEAVLENITPEFLQAREGIISQADVIVVDGSIPQASIEYIAKEYGVRRGVKVVFDPAGFSGSVKAKDVLDGIYCVAPGRMEAEIMTGKNVLSEEELAAAGKFFTEGGVQRVIITIKGGGLYYREGDAEGIIRPEKVITFGNTSGAGDVVSAAVAACCADDVDIEQTARGGMEAAAEFLKDAEYVRGE